MRPAVALAGWAALALIAAFSLGAAALVASAADRAGALEAADWRAARFTVTQAALSALLSVAFAVPVARALSRRRFAGRAAMVRLMGAPFLLPAVVTILGISAVWGRAGWVSEALAALGLARLDIYGMPGVLLAHVFLNLPLAARLLLQAYDEIPAERWRSAAQLGLEGRTLWRAVEWPALRAAAPGALAAIFAVCATSFAVALALGGGPRATTLELAIYEAAAYSFDLSRAAQLAALQLALCAGAALAALALAAPLACAPGHSLAQADGTPRWDGRSRGARARDAAALTLATLFLSAPMLAVTIDGVGGLSAVAPGTWSAIGAAAGRTLVVALTSAALALALALPLAAFAAALSGARGRLAEAAGLAPLAVSPFVLGVALFIALRPFADPAALALALTAVVNAVMAAPYALRMLTPPLRAAFDDHGRLAESLGLGGWTRVRALYAARMRGPIGFSAGLAAALSAGDLGVIALFSAPQTPTLPLLMHLLATSRQLDAAASAALILLGLSFGLFWLFDRAGRG